MGKELFTYFRMIILLNQPIIKVIKLFFYGIYNIIHTFRGWGKLVGVNKKSSDFYRIQYIKGLFKQIEIFSTYREFGKIFRPPTGGEAIKISIY